jgi:LPXTG-motif cell wall-anchored protein
VTHTNIGTATGTGSPGGGTVKDTDPAKALVPAVARIDLEKFINNDDADTTPVSVGQGSTMNIKFTVKNTGNVTLSNVTVTDDKVAASAIDCPGPGVSNVISSLAVGVTVECTATLPAAAPGVTHTNIGTATGTGSPGGGTVKDTDPAKALVPTAPGISIVKSVNGQDADTAPGPFVVPSSTLAFTYVVKNTGNVTLTNVTVTDNKGIPVSCPVTTLAVNASTTCTASGPAPAAGQYTNIGTATGTTPTGATVTANNPANAFAAVPAVRIIKRVNGQDANAAPGVTVPPNTTMQFTYEVTNTGNVPLSDLVVTDNKGVAVTCPGTTLAPGASMTCTGSAPSPASGLYSNIGTVTGRGPDTTAPPGGNPLTAAALPTSQVTDSDPANANVPGPGAPGITLVKMVNGFDANTAPGVIVAAGTTLTFTFTVTNSGAVALTGVTVTDDKLGPITCPSTTLAVGASMNCTATGPAPAAGQYTNVGTATGTPPSGPPVTSTDNANAFVAVPGIEIVKFVNGADANSAPGLSVPEGSAVTWTYQVTNTGNVDLAEVKVVDDKGVKVDCGGGSNVILLLKPTEQKTCTATGVAIAGLYTNIGTATGTPKPPLVPGQPPLPETPVSDADSANYTGTPQAVVLPPPPVIPEGELPETGSDNGGMLGLALGLLGVGGLLLLAAKKGRRSRPAS